MGICYKSSSSKEKHITDVQPGVIDPEIGENIVDLGLVYGVDVLQNTTRINLILTSSACPMGKILLVNTHEKLTRLLSKKMRFSINLVREPVLNTDIISTEVKRRLGLNG